MANLVKEDAANGALNIMMRASSGSTQEPYVDPKGIDRYRYSYAIGWLARYSFLYESENN